jgi:hypothetical protein
MYINLNPTFVYIQNLDFGSEDKKKRVARLQQLEFQVSRKTQNVLSLQIIQVAIKGKTSHVPDLANLLILKGMIKK